MDEAVKPSRRIVFAPFEVDLRTGELRKHGSPIKLQAQSFRVLEMLLERPREVVSRDELKRKLWPTETFGDFDHGLNKSINKVREALGDSALNPRYIETVSRRGYRFIANVTYSDAALDGIAQAPAGSAESVELRIEAPLAAPARASILRRFRWHIIMGVLVVAVSSIALIQRLQPTHGAAAIRSIAVLPLENLSNDEAQEYFADGMTDELITRLGNVNGLRVISRTSSMLYKHVRKPLPRVARELDVDAIVEGTVLRSGNQVRITAQLIRATTDEHLWARSYQGDLRQALQLQDQVAWSIVDQIRVKVTPHDRMALNGATDVSPEAHDAYLKGRYFWNKRTADGLQRAAAYFTEATKIDPNYALAYSGLADSYALLGDWEYGVLSPKEAFPRAKVAAAKALALNRNLGEAHASLALCLKSFDWDWKSAEVELKQALKLNPNYASAHQWYGWLLIILSRNNEGITELKEAEALDPLSLIMSADIADALLIDHQYTASIQQSRRTIEMDPTFAMAHFQLAQALIATRHYDGAIEELQQAIELSRRNPICTSHLGYVYGLMGRTTEARKIVAELENDSAQVYRTAADIALIYAGLDERDRAFAWLENAYENRFNPAILLRPAFDPLRSDPRFQSLLRRLGLPGPTP